MPRFNRRRKSWWWNETIQEVIKEKKEAYKKWQKSDEEEDREACSKRKGKQKIQVAKAKHSSWEERQRRSSEPKQRLE